MNQKIKKFKNQGFTLIEILVVVTIIGLVASIIVVGLDHIQARSRDAKRIADIKSLKSAIEIYQAKNKTYPMPSCPGNPAVSASEVTVESGADYLNALLSAENITGAAIADPVNGTMGLETYKFYYNACGSAGGHTPDPDGLSFNNNNSFVVSFNLETSSFDGQGYKKGFNCSGPDLTRGQIAQFFGGIGGCNVSP